MVRSLGAKGVRVPPGFATTAEAYWQFVDANGLRSAIAGALRELEGRQDNARRDRADRSAAPSCVANGPRDSAARSRPRTASFAGARQGGCRRCGALERDGGGSPGCELRRPAGDASSTSAARAALLDACRRCYASLFTDRAISYRQAKGFDHMKVALSVGVQSMVRSDLGGAGVMFSIDTETGFDRVVLINAAWGLGENVVQGAVDPTSTRCSSRCCRSAALTPIIEKRLGEQGAEDDLSRRRRSPTRNVPTAKAERAAFVLSDQEILTLARWACVIEDHYGRPMDIEWAKDGETRRAVHRAGTSRDGAVAPGEPARIDPTASSPRDENSSPGSASATRW